MLIWRMSEGGGVYDVLERNRALDAWEGIEKHWKAWEARKHCLESRV